MASHTIRLKADSKNTNFSIVDSLTNEPLFWWRGNDLRIEIALSDAGQFLTSSDIGSINVVVKDLNATADDAALMITTLGASDCDSTFTANDFNRGVKQLCVAEFTRVDSALDAGEYVIVISHTDPNGNRSTHLHSRILVKEDQHDSLSLSAPPTPATDYYTKEEIDVRGSNYAKIYKSVREIILGKTNDDVLALDPVLFVDLPIGLYRVDSNLFYYSNAGGVNGGIQVGLGGTAIASTPAVSVRGAYSSSTATASYGNLDTFNSTAKGSEASNANANYLEIVGTLSVTVAGTVGVIWAQHTANAATTSLSRSYLIFTKLD